MDLAVLHIATIASAAAMLVMAAACDARRFKIPNIFSVVLLVLFPLFVASAPHPMMWEQNVMVFGIVLVSGFAAFIANVIGAGDIKLLAATALWAGPGLIAFFLEVTAIAGGVLAIVMLALNRKALPAAEQNVALAKTPMPYGIAIAVGGVGTLFQLSFPS